MSDTQPCLSGAATRSRAGDTVHASHRGVQFTLREAAANQWHWSYVSPEGRRREGQVNGDVRWAMTVVRRGIAIWHLMNRDHAKAA